MSNFSFSNSVFKRPVLQTCKNQGLFGKGLKSFEIIQLCFQSFTAPPSSNDPLADFKRERQKYKNLRKQQGGKGQSREEITLSLLDRFKNKLNSAKMLAGDYSDEEEDKPVEEEDVTDLSW